VAWNLDAAALLEIEPGEAESPFWIDAFSGRRLVVSCSS
jgi:hypothetical protein